MTVWRQSLSRSSRAFMTSFAVLAVVAAAGLAAAFHMEHEGHWVTGMNNRVVWGLPHVFAIFLIVAASGALNVASVASVFSRTDYKPLAPLSALLAIALLAGGLAILVLDLGRPDRLMVTVTGFNPTSIFAWNVLLYNGFFLLAGLYLWTMLVRRRNGLSKPVGLAAFLWRLILTGGTGSIFGFLAAREVYAGAVMVPLFIAMSLTFGLAVFVLVWLSLDRLAGIAGDTARCDRLVRLLGLFVAATAYLVIAQHLTALYAARGVEIERFLLVDGPFAAIFWVGQIAIGTVLPLLLAYRPGAGRFAIPIAAAVVLGGLAQLYVLVIGGQSWPMAILPGYAPFDSAAWPTYHPAVVEGLVGLGGVALALLLTLMATAAFRLLPADGGRV